MKYKKYPNSLMLSAVAAFVLFMAPAAFGQAAALPADWVAYKSANNVFSVSLPAKPTLETQQMGADAGNMKSTYYTSQGGSVFAMIADLHDLPVAASSFDQKTANEIFEGFRSGLLKGFQQSFEQQGLKMEIKFAEQTSVTVQGMKGFDQNVSVGTFKARTRMLLGKDHIFMFFAMGMTDEDAKSADLVLSSFKHLGK